MEWELGRGDKRGGGNWVQSKAGFVRMGEGEKNGDRNLEVQLPLNFVYCKVIWSPRLKTERFKRAFVDRCLFRYIS